MQELQEMEKTIAELSHQQVQLLENINSKKKSLALMRKDRRETKELHRDKLELLRKHLKEATAQVERLHGPPWPREVRQERGPQKGQKEEREEVKIPFCFHVFGKS
uniref:Uncharacterized protein n=1 Tax=Tetraodon nigroviridis TaxID=99883 RepID=H3BW81_TETNG